VTSHLSDALVPAVMDGPIGASCEL